MVTGRRAAVCIGALLAVCVFLVLSTDSAQQLPAVLFGGDWSGSFTTPLAGPASSSIDDAKVELDKEMVSKVGEDPSIGKGVGISGRWSSAFASEPALPSTVADAQAAIEKTLKVRAGEIAAAANAQSRGRGIVGGKARSVQWVPVSHTTVVGGVNSDAAKRLADYAADKFSSSHYPFKVFDDYVRSDDPTRDMDINSLYKHSEDALLNDLNQKLKEKVALEVQQQVAEKVPQMQSALIREQKMKQLVSDITNQMQDVNHGFDQIQVLQAQGHEMFSKADATEADIRSPETKDLFDRAEAILLAMNATVNCTNGTNATGCNSTNTTDAGAGGEDVAAVEKAIRAQSLSLREHKFVLSKMLHQEHVKLAHKKHLEAEAEHKALALLKKTHPHEPLKQLENQYVADRILAARRARAHKEKVERAEIKRKRELEKKLHPKQYAANERKAAKLHAIEHRQQLRLLEKEHQAVAHKHQPVAHERKPVAAAGRAHAEKVELLKKELVAAEHHEALVVKQERKAQHELQLVKRKEAGHKETPLAAAEKREHALESRRASFMKSLASKAAWSKKFLKEEQHEKPLGQLLSGNKDAKSNKPHPHADPEKDALKVLELKKALAECEKDSSKCAHLNLVTKK